MNIQFIHDNKGNTTGVFIPIEEWNELKSKYVDIDLEELEVPQWQIDEVRKRLAAFKKNPNEVIDCQSALNEIEKKL